MMEQLVLETSRLFVLVREGGIIMADETKRVIDQTTDTSLAAGDYVIVDSESEGTRKFDLGQKLEDIDDDFTDVRQDLLQVYVEGTTLVINGGIPNGEDVSY